MAVSATWMTTSSNLPGDPYRAVTLRTFNTTTWQWTIWWLDGRNPGSLDKPVIGGFENGFGTFYAEDELNGRPIRVRFLWSMPAPGRSALGAGLFGGCRRELGDELDHEFLASRHLKHRRQNREAA